MNLARATRFSIVAVCSVLACGPAFAQESDCGVRDPGRFDTDHDGYLSRSEAYGTPIAPLFDSADRGSDGSVSPREFASYCRYRYPSRQERRRDSGGWHDSMGEVMRRQGRRQSDHVTDRIDREMDRATDGSVSRVLDSLFGD